MQTDVLSGGGGGGGCRFLPLVLTGGKGWGVGGGEAA